MNTLYKEYAIQKIYKIGLIECEKKNLINFINRLNWDLINEYSIRSTSISN